MVEREASSNALLGPNSDLSRLIADLDPELSIGVTTLTQEQSDAVQRAIVEEAASMTKQQLDDYAAETALARGQVRSRSAFNSAWRSSGFLPWQAKRIVRSARAQQL